MRKELRGYDPAQVDVFLSRCLATPGIYGSAFPELRGTLAAGERVTAGDIRDVRFDKAMLGYPIRSVDGILRRMQAALEHTDWSVASQAGQDQSGDARTIDLTALEQVNSTR